VDPLKLCNRRKGDRNGVNGYRIRRTARGKGFVVWLGWHMMPPPRKSENFQPEWITSPRRGAKTLVHIVDPLANQFGGFRKYGPDPWFPQPRD